MDKWRANSNKALMLVSSLLMGLAAQPSMAALQPDPAQLYGNEILFDVVRNGSKVGFHSVHFEQMGPLSTVRSRFELEIKLLFFTAYTFKYTSKGFWQNGQLVKFISDVDDDGELLQIKAAEASSGLQVSGPEGTETAAKPLYPTTHWNAAVLKERRVLNTLTGKINEVQITAGPRESVDTEQGTVSATRYNYSGDLETSVWYDDQGRWVKMKFKGRDGSDIEYTCRLCQGGAVQANNDDSNAGK